jgi:hypothetical protein
MLREIAARTSLDLFVTDLLIITMNSFIKGKCLFRLCLDIDSTRLCSTISNDGGIDFVKGAWKQAEIRKFVFHNYRNTALTDWADKGINADIAMKAAGHTSVQMHKRYLDLQRSHVAKAFGLLENGNTDGRQDEPQDHKHSVNS